MAFEPVLDADTQFQSAIYEEIQGFLDSGVTRPEEALRILQTMLDSTFWMIWRMEEADRQAQNDREAAEQWSCGLCDQPTPKGQNVCARCARIPF